MQKLEFETLQKIVLVNKTTWSRFKLALKKSKLTFTKWVRIKINEELEKQEK